mmetsp:Transcript_50051/g.57462  ORF Transcript_50051/g.57462 Transcript_50051/m.57462 type:complete len:660 (+) Transcript_50051:335-2314(+)|eukprot:CAMPEP_0115037976 /NCGR_PEP_ID=MMETSP0216-20121206/43126_1 /TAXON_ID=223996 /ORGANISM="Protocruzia adherens, Strain Boccale" /LENGTH=659 /DNA_ID=CAMNT_0002418273 /DNA_START=266 /DNA_END=2245 /DNA_ORIENTATION=+
MSDLHTKLDEAKKTRAVEREKQQDKEDELRAFALSKGMPEKLHQARVKLKLEREPKSHKSDKIKLRKSGVTLKIGSLDSSASLRNLDGQFSPEKELQKEMSSEVVFKEKYDAVSRVLGEDQLQLGSRSTFQKNLSLRTLRTKNTQDDDSNKTPQDTERASIWETKFDDIDHSIDDELTEIKKRKEAQIEHDTQIQKDMEQLIKDTTSKRRIATFKDPRNRKLQEAAKALALREENLELLPEGSPLNSESMPTDYGNVFRQMSMPEYIPWVNANDHQLDTRDIFVFNHKFLPPDGKSYTEARNIRSAFEEKRKKVGLQSYAFTEAQDNLHFETSMSLKHLKSMPTMDSRSTQLFHRAPKTKKPFSANPSKKRRSHTSQSSHRSTSKKKIQSVLSLETLASPTSSLSTLKSPSSSTTWWSFKGNTPSNVVTPGSRNGGEKMSSKGVFQPRRHQSEGKVKIVPDNDLWTTGIEDGTTRSKLEGSRNFLLRSTSGQSGTSGGTIDMSTRKELVDKVMETYKGHLKHAHAVEYTYSLTPKADLMTVSTLLNSPSDNAIKDWVERPATGSSGKQTPGLNRKRRSVFSTTSEKRLFEDSFADRKSGPKQLRETILSTKTFSEGAQGYSLASPGEATRFKQSINSTQRMLSTTSSWFLGNVTSKKRA